MGGPAAVPARRRASGEADLHDSLEADEWAELVAREAKHLDADSDLIGRRVRLAAVCVAAAAAAGKDGWRMQALCAAVC